MRTALGGWSCEGRRKEDEGVVRQCNVARGATPVKTASPSDGKVLGTAEGAEGHALRALRVFKDENLNYRDARPSKNQS